MNKKAISLVEVLVSVMLISVVIVSLLQIKENNLYFLDKSKETIKNTSYISLIALEDDTKLRNRNVYLSQKIKFDDDEIRRKIKRIKVKVKDKMLQPIEFSDDEYTVQINIKRTSLTIDDNIEKQFFRFILED